MDYGFHPPTIYFPLVVPEALMIEPTETEPKERLDAFVDAMLAIAREAADEPGDGEGRAAHRPVRPARRGAGGKQPIVKYGFEEHPAAPAAPVEPRSRSRRRRGPSTGGDPAAEAVAP